MSIYKVVIYFSVDKTEDEPSFSKIYIYIIRLFGNVNIS